MGRARGVENAREARKAQELHFHGAVVLPGFVEPDGIIAPPGLHMPRKQRETEAARRSADHARYGYLAAGAHTAGAEDFREIVKMLRAIQNAHLRPLRLRSILCLPFAEPGGGNRRLLVAAADKWLPAVQKRRLAVTAEVVIHDGGSPAAAVETQSLVEAAGGLGFALRFRSMAPLSGEQAAAAARAGAISVVAPLGGEETGALGSATVHVVPCAGLLDAPSGGLAKKALAGGVCLALSADYGSMEPGVNPQLMMYLAVRRLGMTPEEAITALTWNAACSLRMSNFAGCIETGRPADLIAVDVGHYSEIARRAGSNDVSLVMRGGRIVYARAAVT
jgi:imidazolonepropionase